MITVPNISYGRTVNSAYASDAIYTFVKPLFGFPAGTRVRLIGNTPTTIGTNFQRGYVTVMRADASVAQWLSVKKTDLNPQPS